MILGVAGYQNSGKTTLIELIAPRVCAAGFTVATVKHIAHDDLRVDAGGSDTQRHRQAGATLAAAVSDAETVYFHGGGNSLDQVLARIAALDAPDLILVEGFKRSGLPKIVIGTVQHGGPAKWRWDGTPEGAAQVAQEILVELRAERVPKANHRATKAPVKAPGIMKARPNASRRSGVRRSRRAGSRRSRVPSSGAPRAPG
jgi:molybdopterin-guanine dinucleotide biosynthesis protein MobB